MTELNKNILFQYFSGTASPLQKKLILEWLQEYPNQEMFYQWLEEWEKEHLQFMPDTGMVLSKIINKIDCLHSEAKEISVHSIVQKKSLFRTRKIWWVAASVLLVLGLPLYIFRDNINYTKYQTAYGQVKEFNLADGSHVVLNANSSLLVPRWDFEKNDRDVILKGEAAFSVVHTKANQKFLVHTDGQLNVEVLGTDFSVYSRNNSNKVELRKGSVKLLFNKQKELKPIFLKPGDIANIGSEGKIFLKHQQAQPNFIAWKEHRFIFNNTPLREAMVSIEEFFGIKIAISDAFLEQKNITGSFKAESADELLAALSEMFSLEIKKEGETILLK